MSTDVRLPEVSVHLSTGQDGNVFMILGAVCSAMRNAGHADLIEAFTDDMHRARSYDDALQCVMRWVKVT